MHIDEHGRLVLTVCSEKYLEELIMPTPKLIATPECQNRLSFFEDNLKRLCERFDVSLRPNTRAEEQGIYVIDRLDTRSNELQEQWPYVASFAEVNKAGVQDWELEDYGNQPPEGI